LFLSHHCTQAEIYNLFNGSAESSMASLAHRLSLGIFSSPLCNPHTYEFSVSVFVQQPDLGVGVAKRPPNHLPPDLLAVLL
jgi:hypothetical protein